MKVLFNDNFDKTSKFIFDFYDFDRDGFITREDIRIVLSYVSLSLNSDKKEKNKSCDQAAVGFRQGFNKHKIPDMDR